MTQVNSARSNRGHGLQHNLSQDPSNFDGASPLPRDTRTRAQEEGLTSPALTHRRKELVRLLSEAIALLEEDALAQSTVALD